MNCELWLHPYCAGFSVAGGQATLQLAVDLKVSASDLPVTITTVGDRSYVQSITFLKPAAFCLQGESCGAPVCGNAVIEAWASPFPAEEPTLFI